MTRKGRTEETLIALQRARRKKEEEKCKQDKMYGGSLKTMKVRGDKDAAR